MIINHNMNAMNAHRQMMGNTAKAGRSMEKLSSGLRINRAGDDAAGLAISEKMRGQIRGLDQAARNGQDGISMIQTAEGALSETHSILQRMRELAVQAGNDTNTDIDRGEIQKEMNQLTSEINRIGNNTEFNTQSLLNGEQSVSGGSGGTSASGAATVDSLGVTVTGQKLDGTVTITFADGGTNASSASWSDSTLTITLGTNNGAESQFDAAAIQTLIDGASGTEPTGYTDAGSLDIDFTGKLDIGDGAITDSIAVKDGAEAGESTGGATLQIGANQSQSFTIDIGDMRSVALGVAGTSGATTAGVGTETVSGSQFASSDDTDKLTDVTSGDEYALDVTSNTKASAAIKVVDQAIEKVSAERSKLGAFQNRLEHTIANLGTASENLTSAESRIRDVDMAKEMMNFSKNNILQQAAQAMLAQANQAPQGVLQLLR